MLDKTHPHDGATSANGGLITTLGDARRLLAHTVTALRTDAPDAVDIAAAIIGTHEVTTALADLVTAVMDHTTTLTDRHDPETSTEVLADLRALHGCLTTGALLLAPALDDLRPHPAGTKPTKGGS
ncbi:hypothetical protein [Amycolatopsis panacis]|uniref:Uncharacterized protein n=1 Tax=Amycolatopsis panacis TaxID=2340917 RepID=A0A419I4Y1_9PSEU|nr:hypothetical protein [Amycolatopsis panacis]RJQ85492.1 hypothetical protein D5S19_14015 [Amycolatopsis panacis]